MTYPDPNQPIGYASIPPQTQADLSHLKTLAIIYYVFGGLALTGMLCGGLYVVMGGAVMAAGASGAATNTGSGDPAGAMAGGGMIMGMGLCMVIIPALFGALYIYSGRCLQQQKKRTLSMVVAGFACLSVPLGTILGIFTFIVLSRPSVKALYDAREAASRLYV